MITRIHIHQYPKSFGGIAIFCEILGFNGSRYGFTEIARNVPVASDETYIFLNFTGSLLEVKDRFEKEGGRSLSPENWCGVLKI